MAYNELIKNFNIIREYMRSFYVYGFSSREEYDKKSGRTYDDAKRRIESYLADHIQYRQNSEGKRVFISVDTRSTVHNPLYQAFKAKSFTDGDITLYFIVFDILNDTSVRLPLGDIVEIIDRDYLSCFDEPKTFDISTIRKKLNEFVSIGLMQTEKQGKTLYYSRKNNIFKHHYINSALDSEIVYLLFEAMHQKQEIEISKISRKGEQRSMKIVPLRIFISVGSGRQYLMAYRRATRRIISFRTDYILTVKPYRKADDFDVLREKLNGMQPYMWGVSTQGRGERKETVEFTVFFDKDEQHIYKRLLREKRCGTVELLDEHHARFYAEVYDTNELLTWIRSFICRITSVSFSNKEIETQLKADIDAMYRIYEVQK